MPPVLLTAMSKLCQANLGLLSHKLGLMEAMTLKHGSDKAKEYFKMTCPLVKASVGQHFRHSLDHMELAAKIAEKPPTTTTVVAELHYDLRERGCPSGYDMDAAAERIINLINILEVVSILYQEHENNNNNNNNIVPQQQQQQQNVPVQAYFMLAGDSDTEYALVSSIGRELGFAAHHAIHHMALVKLIATETIGLSETDLPEGFGRAPSTIRFDQTSTS